MRTHAVDGARQRRDVARAEELRLKAELETCPYRATLLAANAALLALRAASVGAKAAIVAAFPLLSGCAPATVETHASYYVASFGIAALAAIAYAAGSWRARQSAAGLLLGDAPPED